MMIQEGVNFVLIFPIDATPTESEREVYDVVSGVLDNRQAILEELESYPGANQEIRQVNEYLNVVWVSKM